MLTPGTSTWADAIPAIAVSLLLLFVPGTLVAMILRARVALALAIGPAISTAVVVVGGSVAAAAGLHWGVWPLLGSVLAACLGAFALRLAMSWRRVSSAPADAAPRPEDSPGWAQALGVLAGVAGAALVVTWVVLRSANTPEEFPQHPDTIFHLGVTQWMAEHLDVSFQHGTTFRGPGTNAGYPIGFHSMGATVSILTGLPAVVSLSAFVLVLSAVVWPLGMAVLGRTAFGSRPVTGAVAAVTSVLFVAYPFMLMGFGTVWPNLFGQALLPAVVAAVVTLTHRISPVALPASRFGPTVAVLVLAIPGLGVAHPNAVITAVLLAAMIVWLSTLFRALRPGPSPWHRFGPLAAASTALVLGTVASLVVRPAGMVATGAAGPEMPVNDALVDVAGFAPRVAVPAFLLGALVVIGGVVVLWCFRSAAWLVVAAAFLAFLYYINAAVDTPLARLLTWPWYNNAIRIAAVGVLPAALLVAAAVLGPSRWLARRANRGWVVEGVIAAGLLALVVVPSNGFASRDVRWLRPYFHPGVARSWASPQELRALHELAALVPPDGVVAADPWKGGTYMFVVGDRRMYYPTEKTNTTADSRLIGLRLADVGTDPKVCRVVTEAGITHALTGGVPFLWGGSISRTQYTGIEAVAHSSAWREVARRGPYTLYELTACAGR